LKRCKIVRTWGCIKPFHGVLFAHVRPTIADLMLTWGGVMLVWGSHV
jgi:hypothetical protein